MNLRKWNWGAAFFNLPYLWAHNRQKFVIMLLVSFIPVAGAVLSIVLSGMYGEKWALEGGKIAAEAFEEVMNSWQRAGKFSLIMLLVVAVIYVVMLVVILGIGLTATSLY